LTSGESIFAGEFQCPLWAADNAAALKDAKPLFPANFNNRLRANWRLLLAIAELAAGTWPKQARGAAERLARTIRNRCSGGTHETHTS
jgi:hypothetical protein